MLSCRPLFTLLHFNRLWALHPTTSEQDYHFCSLPSFPICEPLLPLVPLFSVAASVLPARLGLKAMALAWLEAALAFRNPRPGQSRRLGLGPGLARPGPRLF